MQIYTKPIHNYSIGKCKTYIPELTQFIACELISKSVFLRNTWIYRSGPQCIVTCLHACAVEKNIDTDGFSFTELARELVAAAGWCQLKSLDRYSHTRALKTLHWIFFFFRKMALLWLRPSTVESYSLRVSGWVKALRVNEPAPVKDKVKVDDRLSLCVAHCHKHSCSMIRKPWTDV